MLVLSLVVDYEMKITRLLKVSKDCIYIRKECEFTPNQLCSTQFHARAGEVIRLLWEERILIPTFLLAG